MKDLDIGNWSNEELDALQSKISSIKNEREEQLKNCLVKKDLDGLKLIMEKMKISTLREKDFIKIYTYQNSGKNFEFIDYILSSKGFKEYVHKNDILKKIVESAYRDISLFEKMESKYEQELQSFQNEMMKSNVVCHSVLKKLFEEGKVKYSTEDFKEAVKTSAFPYVEYCLDNGLVKDFLEKEKFPFYCTCLKKLSFEILNKIGKAFPDIYEYKLENLISRTLEKNDYHKEQYKSFINRFKVSEYHGLIKNFKVGQEFIMYNIFALSNIRKEDYIFAFVDGVYENDTNNFKIIKDNLNKISNQEIKNIFQKACLCFELEKNLKYQPNIVKMKL